MFEIFGAIGGIVLVDLVLSGDNALVIGAAAANLPRKQRLMAILFGGGGAIVLRILFAILATLLLQLPLIQAIGAVVLIIIAIRLLAERDSAPGKSTSNTSTQNQPSRVVSFPAAIATILVADVTMSLDNVLAVGAIANGQILFLAIGILLSLVILMIGSALVAELIGRLPWLLDLAALVLAWTGANMLLDDIRLGPLLGQLPGTQIAVPLVLVGIVLLADILLRKRDRRRAQSSLHA